MHKIYFLCLKISKILKIKHKFLHNTHYILCEEN
nr:MAG TPA: hypothetical protein [Caudoviricetes sp.]